MLWITFMHQKSRVCSNSKGLRRGLVLVCIVFIKDVNHLNISVSLLIVYSTWFRSTTFLIIRRDVTLGFYGLILVWLVSIVEYIDGGATQNPVQMSQVSSCIISHCYSCSWKCKRLVYPFYCWFAVVASNPRCNKLHGLYRKWQVWWGDYQEKKCWS